MTKFNTGNPVGSSDPRDLFDNAGVTDNLVTGAGAAYNDRLGKSRKSWQGMEDEFAAFIAASGYEFVGDYAAGIEITGYNQVVRDTGGEFWRVSGSTNLPYTTTGAGLPEGGSFVAVGDAALRQDLNAETGSGKGALLVRGATIFVDSVAELEALPDPIEGQESLVRGVPFKYSGSAWVPSLGFVSPFCYSGVGDGVADDYLAVKTAKDTGYAVDYTGGKWRIAGGKLLFDKPSQKHYSSDKASIIFDMASTTRLADITADNVFFDGIVFDGNNRQPRTGLVYLKAGIKRPTFWHCSVKNIVGEQSGSNQLNQTYGFLIDYNAVQGFVFVDCDFEDLIKYNDGSRFTQLEGVGFIGGIAIHSEDGTDPTIVQTAPSSGIITHCRFKNIQTILNAGLSDSQQVSFNDADGIRIYGKTGVFDRADVDISHCQFDSVSKRAVKSAAAGVHCSDFTITANKTQYRMVTLVKLNNNNSAKNITCITDETKPLFVAYQLFYQDADNSEGVLVDNCDVPHCRVGFEWIAASATTDVKNVEILNTRFSDVGVRGFNQGGVTPASQDVFLNNVEVYGRNADTAGLTVTGAGGIRIGTALFVNADVKLQGPGIEYENLTIVVDNATYAGRSAGVALVEISQSGSARVQSGRLKVDARGASDNYVNGSRPYLVLLYGDNNRFGTVDVEVSETLDINVPHLSMYGNDSEIENLIYTGRGTIDIGNLVASSRLAVRSAIRKGTGATTSIFIRMNNAGSEGTVIGQVIDYRPTSAASVRLVSGASAVAMSVASRSTLSATQDDTGGGLTVMASSQF
ncbi:hypothetical protein [Marinobacter sp. UBA2678]|uniref:hypothetical protein n=1 Tax=Marinobacter sp. UBA2678 TaxID=1946815 RepID=UPI000C0A4D5E|nr:hypothetical protein [Marinobacter sp. UBA2678]MAM85698.1 hypothetical protein [Hahellaceae bacterium]|tara:strand:- start:225 stop:2630 length:2406 start_codon:yes stop_codon:yes gene_type:complete